MSDAPVDEIEIRNRAALEELAQTLEWSVGAFHLLLARCNYASVRSHLIAQLLEICPITIQVITLSPTTQKLYTTIREALTDPLPQAVVVVGFEQVQDLDHLFAAADSAREEFRKNFAMPLVFWLEDDQFNRFKHRAPNFESWAPVDTPVFAIAPTAILQSLEQGRTAIFEAAFDPAQIDLPDAIHGITHLGALQRSELPQALRLLEELGVGLRPDLEADLQFIQGCYLSRHNGNDNLAEIEAALDFFKDNIAHYRTSLPTLPSIPNVRRPPSPANLRLALTLFFSGRCQFQRIDLARRTSQMDYAQTDWEEARDSLLEAVQLFDQCDRPDMTAKIILRLVHTLGRLEDWDGLEQAAQRAIALHEAYNMPTRAGEPYGFLAEVALHRGQWAEARDFAQQALRAIAPLPVVYRWAEGLYLSFQARAEAQLGNGAVAISLLERARDLGDRGHPTTYCRALEALRELYRQQKRYLEAFKLKQAQLEVEKIAGIRAFVGAGRLGAQAQLLADSNNPDALPPEIRASGRQLDLRRLIERIGRNDFKLTVIHGSSGVGKSSLMNAGLIPTLKGRGIGTRDNRVVLVRKYTDWLEHLWDGILEAGSPLSPPLLRGEAESSVESPGDPAKVGKAERMAEVVEWLRECDRHNLRPIIILDQFEEFFFANPSPLERRRFFEFLGECLHVPFINVILSLRDDYIHYLLEANKAKGLGAIGSDILSSNVLYGLGNFPPEDAKAIIEDLTGRSRLSLSPDLIEALVDDLAGELREVRPIELQVVGAQLETLKIHDLAAYRALGAKPKEELVTRYLQEVVQDCGEEYAPLAARVLYELTDERGTRPLKTRPELQRELEAAQVPLPPPPTHPAPTERADDPLDYVLRMLSGSGLVVYLPEVPDDRYQLIHDYIAEVVRQKYAPNTAAELAAEREKRIAAESLLAVAQGKNQKAQRRVVIASAFLTLSLVTAAVAGAIANNALEQVGKARNNTLQAQNDRTFAEAFRQGAARDRENAFQERDEVRRDAEELETSNERARQELANAEEQFTLAQQANAQAQQELIASQELQRRANHERGLAQDATRLERAGISSMLQFEVNQTQGLLSALRASYELYQLHQRNGIENLEDYIATSPILALQIGVDTYQETIIEMPWLAFSDTVTTISPDGSLIATNGNIADWNNSEIWLWSLDGNPTELQGSRGHSWSLAISQNGNLIATITQDGSIGLWESNGMYLVELSDSKDFLDSTFGVPIVFSPSGTYIAVVSAERIIRVWKTTGEYIATIEESDNSDNFNLYEDKIFFSQDEQSILVSRRSDDGYIVQIYDNDMSANMRSSLTVPGNSLAVSPQGNLIATRDQSGYVHLWDISSEPSMLTLENSQGSYGDIVFSPQGDLIGTFTEEGIQVWDTNGSPVVTLDDFRTNSESPLLFFSPNSSRIAANGNNTTAQVWEIDGSQIPLPDNLTSDGQLVFSPDGNRLLTHLQRGYDPGILVVNLSSYNSTMLEQYTIENFYSDPVYSYGHSSYLDFRNNAWNENRINLLRFDFSGNYLQLTDDSGNARHLWNLSGDMVSIDERSLSFTTGNTRGWRVNRSANYDSSQILNPNGHVAATLNTRSQVRVSNHGSIVAILEDNGEQQIGNITLQDLSGNYIAKLSNHNRGGGYPSDIYEIVFSPTDEYLITVDAEGLTRLWTAGGQQIAVLNDHQGEVSYAAFSPDGKKLITTGRDHKTRIWNLQGQQIAQYDGLLAAISPDWSRIAVIQPAGTHMENDAVFALWQIDDLDELIVRACEQLRPYLLQSRNVSNADRAMCNLPPRDRAAVEQSGAQSHNLIARLAEVLRGWFRA